MSGAQNMFDTQDKQHALALTRVLQDIVQRVAMQELMMSFV